jgi:hypothetical protein
VEQMMAELKLKHLLPDDIKAAGLNNSKSIEYLPRIIVGRADRIEQWLDEQNVRSLYRLSKQEPE